MEAVYDWALAQGNMIVLYTFLALLFVSGLIETYIDR